MSGKLVPKFLQNWSCDIQSCNASQGWDRVIGPSVLVDERQMAAGQFYSVTDDEIVGLKTRSDIRDR